MSHVTDQCHFQN